VIAPCCPVSVDAQKRIAELEAQLAERDRQLAARDAEIAQPRRPLGALEQELARLAKLEAMVALLTSRWGATRATRPAAVDGRTRGAREAQRARRGPEEWRFVIGSTGTIDGGGFPQTLTFGPGTLNGPFDDSPEP
jgi:hypothetical protein